MAGINWSDAELASAIDVLRSTPRGTRLQDACGAVSTAIGRRVTDAMLRSAFKTRGCGTPASFLGMGGVALSPVASTPSPLPYVEVDVDLDFDDAGAVSGKPAPSPFPGFVGARRQSDAIPPLTDGEPDWNAVMPPNQRLRGNSSMLDAAGEVERRWVKTERDSDDPTKFLPVPEGHLIKKVSTLLDGQGKVRAQWLQAPKDEQTRWDEFWKACERSVEAYRGLAGATRAPVLSDARTLTVYPLGDPHIGMLSWGQETGADFDLKIAEADLVSAVDLMVDRAPNSRRAILANVGDFFHAESDEQRTPGHGNKLDCDTRWAKITDVGFTIMRRLVDRLLTKHTAVEVVNLPGNHDPRMSRMLAMWLQAVYEKEPRVTVLDNANPFTYVKHGRNLFGFAHGDNVKPEQLPGIMATDRPEDWGASDYRLWITGHVHHMSRKEFPGCLVESFRTLASRDYWHNWKGYRSGQSLSCITFDEQFGEVTRSTVELKQVRQARA